MPDSLVASGVILGLVVARLLPFLLAALVGVCPGIIQPVLIGTMFAATAFGLTTQYY